MSVGGAKKGMHLPSHGDGSCKMASRVHQDLSLSHQISGHILSFIFAK